MSHRYQALPVLQLTRCGPGVWVLENLNLVALNDNAGEFTSRIGTGVDVDPVGPHIDFTYRRMAVHDDIAVNIAKLPSVPRQILTDIPKPPNTASRDVSASLNVRASEIEGGRQLRRPRERRSL